MQPRPSYPSSPTRLTLTSISSRTFPPWCVVFFPMTSHSAQRWETRAQIAMLAVHESSSLRKLLECRIPSTSEVVAAFPDFEKHDVLEVFSSIRWEEMRSDLLLPGPLSRPLTPQAPSFLAYLLVLHQHSPPRFLSVPVRARPRVRKDLLFV